MTDRFISELNERIERVKEYWLRTKKIKMMLKVNFDIPKEIKHLKTLREITNHYKNLFDQLKTYDTNWLKKIADKYKYSTKWHTLESVPVSDETLRYLIGINIINTIDYIPFKEIGKYFREKSFKNDIKSSKWDFIRFRADQGYILFNLIKYTTTRITQVQNSLQGNKKPDKQGVWSTNWDYVEREAYTDYEITREIKKAIDSFRGRIPLILYRGTSHTKSKTPSLTPSLTPSHDALISAFSTLNDIISSFPYKKIKTLPINMSSEDINTYSDISNIDIIRHKWWKTEFTWFIQK